MRPGALLATALLLMTALAGCADEVAPEPTEDDPRTPAPSMDAPDASPPRGSPRASFTHSDTYGLDPLVVTFNLTFTKTQGRTVEWRIDNDADGNADAWGMTASNETILHEHRYPDGESSAAALVLFNNTTVLHKTITIEAFEGDQYESFLDQGLEEGSCTEAEEWEEDDHVRRLGFNHGNQTPEFKVDDATHGSDFTALFEIPDGFHRAWAFLAEDDGNIVEIQKGFLQGGGVIRLEGTVPQHADWVVLYLCGDSKTFSMRYVA